jgi:ribosomal protein L36
VVEVWNTSDMCVEGCLFLRRRGRLRIVNISMQDLH